MQSSREKLYPTIIPVEKAKPNQTLKLLQRAHSEHPDDFEISQKLMYAYVELHDYHHAITICISLVNKFKTNIELWCHLGYFYFKSHHYKAAEHAYNHATELDSSYLPAYIGKIDALRAQGMFEKAILICRELLVRKLALVDVYNRLTWLFIATDKYHDALAAANDAITLDTNNIYALLNRGLIYQFLSHTAEHSHDWMLAKDKWSDAKLQAVPDTYCQLGKMWEKLHLKKYAKSCYDITLYLTPDHNLAAKSLESIDSSDVAIVKSEVIEGFVLNEADLKVLEARLLERLSAIKEPTKIRTITTELTEDEIIILKNITAKHALASSEMAKIETIPALREYHDVFKRTVYQSFVACLAINSEMLEPAAAGRASSMVANAISGASKFFEKFTTSLPFISQISAAISYGTHAYIKLHINNRVKNLLLCFDVTQAHEQIHTVAAKLTLIYEVLILEQKADKTNSLLQFFKKIKDMIVFDEIDTPAKALALMHAQEIIVLAMSGQLKVFSHETIHTILSEHSESSGKTASLFLSSPKEIHATAALAMA